MNPLMTKLKVIAAGAAVLATLPLIIGCASPEEKQARRDNAFDLSGGYKASVQSGSELDMNFEIVNESGRTDIAINLSRLSPLSEKEKKLLTDAHLDPATVYQHFFSNPLALGRGRTPDHLEGGDNISDDFGATSRFSVCSDSYQYNPEYSLYYCLGATATKQQRLMQGTLTLRRLRTETVKDPQGQPTTKYTIDEIQLKFKTDMDQVFYKQYLGGWSGHVQDVHSSANAKELEALFSNIAIQEQANHQFVVLPLRQKNGVTFNGAQFVYSAEESQLDSADLQVPDSPALMLVLKGPANQRIVFAGQIWSLGNLSGSIMHIDTNTQIDLAVVRLKKN